MRIGSRESVFYDEDMEVKAAPMPSGNKWASPSPQAWTVSAARLHCNAAVKVDVQDTEEILASRLQYLHRH